MLRCCTLWPRGDSAFHAILSRVVLRLPSGKAATSDEPLIVQDLHWRALESKRAMFVERTMGEAMLIKLIVLSLVLEPLRYMSRWWMKR